MRIRRIGALVATVVAAAVLVSVDTQARVNVVIKASERPNAVVTDTIRLYDDSLALVIGIDAYTAGWPPLRSAVKDARIVAETLRQKGFIVTLRTNLDSESLRRELRHFFTNKGYNPENRLLLWFAGHGHTIDGEGFLVPADAPPAHDPNFLSSALHMRDLGGLTRLAQSKHVLSVFDSCFSGTIFRTRSGAAPRAITRKTTKPVRQFLTSGDAGQQVRDDGSFSEYFIRALRGDEGSDINGDGYVTGEELGLFMNQEMTALTEGAQTPKSGKLHDVRFNQGDFVFMLPDDSAGTGKHSGDEISLRTTGDDPLYWVQLGSSRDVARAKKVLRGQLSRHSDVLGGIPSRVFRVDLGDGGVWYRMQIGAFEAEAEARRLAAVLKRRGLKGPYVVRSQD